MGFPWRLSLLGKGETSVPVAFREGPDLCLQYSATPRRASTDLARKKPRSEAVNSSPLTYGSQVVQRARLCLSSPKHFGNRLLRARCKTRDLTEIQRSGLTSEEVEQIQLPLKARIPSQSYESKRGRLCGASSNLDASAKGAGKTCVLPAEFVGCGVAFGLDSGCRWRCRTRSPRTRLARLTLNPIIRQPNTPKPGNPCARPEQAEPSRPEAAKNTSVKHGPTTSEYLEIYSRTLIIVSKSIPPPSPPSRFFISKFIEII